MNLINQFNKYWYQHYPNWNPNNCHLLLAVSGGVDSVVLVDLIKKSGFNFSIAHCNFQLRGQDSNRDELFVSSLGGATEIFIKKFDTSKLASQQRIAIQEAARNLRYDWFAELLIQLQSKSSQKVLIVTAHHGDDNIETVFMHFFRGTGISGLRGILTYQKERSLIRPLLGCRKEQLINYADENNLQYVEDISNESDKYTRNFVRNKLIPQIKSIYPDVEHNILDNIERFKELSIIYHDAINSKLNKLLEKKGSEIHIPILKLKKEKTLATIVWEFSKGFGFSTAQTTEIIKLLDANNGAYISSSTHQIIKNRKWLIIAKKEDQYIAVKTINTNDSEIHFALGRLTLRRSGASFSQLNLDSLHACIDEEQLQFPILLRKVKTGDYFYPLGMQKKKKISRFLIDQKLSKTQKENCWVLESNKKIIWIIGYRIDDRVKIRENTTKLLLLQLTPTNP